MGGSLLRRRPLPTRTRVRIRKLPALHELPAAPPRCGSASGPRHDSGVHLHPSLIRSLLRESAGLRLVLRRQLLQLVDQRVGLQRLGLQLLSLLARQRRPLLPPLLDRLVADRVWEAVRVAGHGVVLAAPTAQRQPACRWWGGWALDRDRGGQGVRRKE